MQYFWQNFPKALEASDDTVVVRLFPRQYGDVHEIQGGEQKTHTFVVAFGQDDVATVPLEWARAPLFARATPAWYCSSGVAYLVPSAESVHGDYDALARAAIDGEDTFARKREVIDEYGWRNFGDIYGDHEAVRRSAGPPLISHYNNQYDPVAGFAHQFFRSGDPRWWLHMVQLASHVVDIDAYHTDRDKAAYNRGLFWHTYHYVDADTATHRSYPRASKVGGGGPSSEHNYTTGLTLHYFLTGDPLSRTAAIDLGRFVIDMDDGRKSVFRWLDRGDTGLASASGSFDYHGPGRGGANSLNALLDAHRLTGDVAFMRKAEQLIRRCVHPADDISRHTLLDAERKWFYTMFLQALGKYLDYKAECGELDWCYAYARESLLHYARWMARHEYPYLDKPELLQYPTETWAAQDMRKSEVFTFAARHAVGDERARFLDRARFFFRYSIDTLSGMKTRTLARPVVILLSFGLMQEYFERNRHLLAAPPPVETAEFGPPQQFVPRKGRARRRAIAAGAAGLLALAAALAYVMA